VFSWQVRGAASPINGSTRPSAPVSGSIPDTYRPDLAVADLSELPSLIQGR
jgi:hypothetical protein